MASPINEPKKGRVLPCKKEDTTFAITTGEFSVLVSDGFFQQEDETRSGAKRTKRFGEMYFYADRDDAMEGGSTSGWLAIVHFGSVGRL